MPAQGTEAELVRRKTTDSETSFPDEAIDLLFDEAETKYTGYSRQVIFQSVVVERLEEIWTESTKHVTYQSNELRENLSDTAKNLKDRIEAAKTKLDELIKSEKGVALRTAVMKRVPTRIKGYPNG
jgi:ElaB/YqjD/DUF883 family membrane-anchored ribosome-binding protein